jgi:hypothetical protein
MMLRFCQWPVAAGLILVVNTGCTATLPTAAQTTIDTRFPNATIDECEAKFGHMYEVELTDNHKQHEVLVHKDGTLVELETSLSEDELPEPVAATAKEHAEQHPLTEIERVEQLARKTKGGFETLDKPVVYYELEWKEWIFEREIKVNPDGTTR